LKVTEPTPALIDTVEAAALLGVTRVTVVRWIECGQLPAVRVGDRGRWRIVRGHIDRLVREQSVVGRDVPVRS
jgi:excisionase family DNA binding protein